jgi:hypothetical protein
MMNKQISVLRALLSRHRIDDPAEFLREKSKVPIVSSDDASDVSPRGSVQLMEKQLITMEEVETGLKKLKYL